MGKKGAIIGVTGGLATGKTTVTDLFVELGALRIDADAISHDILEGVGEVKKRIIGLFGDEILSGGTIDRRKLARAVFSDEGQLKKLSAIMHPAIVKSIRKKIAEAAGRVVVVDAPLLIECGLCDEVDIVIVVTAGYDTQIKRAIARGIKEEEAKNIIKNQMAFSEKAEFADHIIDNDGERGKIKEGVERIWQKIWQKT
jgi:dephospho-CoA kinase